MGVSNVHIDEVDFHIDGMMLHIYAVLADQSSKPRNLPATHSVKTGRAPRYLADVPDPSPGSATL